MSSSRKSLCQQGATHPAMLSFSLSTVGACLQGVRLEQSPSSPPSPSPQGALADYLLLPPSFPPPSSQVALAREVFAEYFKLVRRALADASAVSVYKGALLAEGAIVTAGVAEPGAGAGVGAVKVFGAGEGRHLEFGDNWGAEVLVQVRGQWSCMGLPPRLWRQLGGEGAGTGAKAVIDQAR